jgi:hypothetical protein
MRTYQRTRDPPSRATAVMPWALTGDTEWSNLHHLQRVLIVIDVDQQGTDVTATPPGCDEGLR